MKATWLWIDTEFNGFQGDLISMALVDMDDNEWYESLGCGNPTHWVAVNVMPVIGKAPIGKQEMQISLHDFLSDYERIHIISDWPEDIAHFCNLLITGPGQRINTPPLTMEVRRDLDAVSAVPHNALADARAIRDLHMSMLHVFA